MVGWHHWLSGHESVDMSMLQDLVIYTGNPGMLLFMGSQRRRHDWMTDLSCSLSFHPQIDREDVIYIVECYSAIRRMKLCYLQKNGWNWGYYTLYRRQEARSYPRKRNALKKADGCLRRLWNSCEKKRSWKQRRKGKIYPFECRVPKNSKERWGSFPQLSMQRNKGKH